MTTTKSVPLVASLFAHAASANAWVRGAPTATRADAERNPPRP